ncbi:hypothetical protein E4P29_18675 [Rhodococcus sp. 1R11]|jgi:hypothetical protein|uniref:hypothetical protein n=1 Tax=Rhodococcus sp. 1R11 TaxID=2559614 RepID=UPI0010720285|nr:hypothetical protein [Rhodococcus sp. 1R11]TFI42075.1 hypothetical protein E4P29_18675 [Rhodococcus sp. 1R11]
MADAPVKTYWNGQETPAVRGTAVVADSGRFPRYWAREENLVGERIEVVLVDYAGDISYLDNRTGFGWYKVTEGHGSPAVGHKNLSIKPGSFRQHRPHPVVV